MIPKIKSSIPFLVVLITASSLFLFRLGANSLADWDEAWYADASRFMFRRDHFLTPIWNGRYFFDKPPLQYWLTQPFLYIFGETELAYRLPSALAAIGLTLITYVWGMQQGWRAKGPRSSARTPSELTNRGGGRRIGLSAAAILLTFPHFLDRGRSGNFDSLFVFFITLSLFLMIKNRPALGGIFLGLSWLTKGVFSGLFPITVFFIIAAIVKFAKLHATNAGFANFKLKPLLIYIFSAIVIYAPWHILEYTRFDHLINQSYFATFDQGEFGGVNWMDIAWRFDLRYLVFLWTFLRWWFPFLLISIIWQFHQTSERGRARQDPDRFLPFISFVVIFLALSAAKSKNDWYIMPAYPFIALMIADFIFNIFRTIPIFWSLRQNIAGAPEPCTDALRERPASNCVAVGGRREVSLVRGFFLPFFFIFSVSILNLYLYRRQAFPPDKWLPQKELGLTVKNLTGPDDLVVTAEYEFPALRYYSEREVRTAARQPDYEGKYWWIWDNTDIATALRHGRDIITIHRPGAEWPIDVWGYRREKLTETNGRIISRLLLQTPP